MNFQQPLSAALHGNTSDSDLSREGYKPEKNNILKQHNERMRQQETNEYLQVNFVLMLIDKFCKSKC